MKFWTSVWGELRQEQRVIAEKEHPTRKQLEVDGYELHRAVNTGKETLHIKTGNRVRVDQQFWEWLENVTRKEIRMVEKYVAGSD